MRPHARRNLRHGLVISPASLSYRPRSAVPGVYFLCLVVWPVLRAASAHVDGAGPFARAQPALQNPTRAGPRGHDGRAEVRGEEQEQSRRKMIMMMTVKATGLTTSSCPSDSS
jgi:hypothetical protein